MILYSEEKGRAAILQSQMQEIRERQAEAALMEQQRSSLLKEQAELEKAVRQPTLHVCTYVHQWTLDLPHPLMSPEELN